MDVSLQGRKANSLPPRAPALRAVFLQEARSRATGSRVMKKALSRVVRNLSSWCGSGHLRRDLDRGVWTARHHVDVVRLDDQPGARVPLRLGDHFGKLGIVVSR